jgi:uncharacterized protein YndB with AHSA1/START domain
MHKLYLLGLLFAGAPVAAEVVDSGDSGFTVRERVNISATPERVWAGLVDVSHWWSGEHSWSGDASNFSLDPRPGGCWCEKLPGGGVVHQTVVFLDRNKMLRLSGALGPMQGMGVSGVSTYTLKPAEQGTLLELSYVAGGYRPGGFAKFAPNVDGVLAEQLGRLKSLVETGKATP